MKNSKLSELVKNFTAKLTYRQSIMLAALCCALLAALIIFFPAGGGEKKVAQQPVEQAPAVQKTKVVKAAMDIPNRTFIKEEMLKVEEVDEKAVPQGAVTEMNVLIGKPTSTNILKGDVITDKKFYKDLNMLGFAGLIPDDCRAMTVPISDITAVAGFLSPGDYVDVMLVESADVGKAQGELILQNVLLLAINRNGTKPDPNKPRQQPQKSDKKDKKEGDKQQQQGEQQPDNTVNASPDAMSMATLALTPTEALELAAKSQHGTIYLSMRPFKPTDTFVTETEYKEAGAVEAENNAEQRNDEVSGRAMAAMDRMAQEYSETMGSYREALQQAIASMREPSDSSGGGRPSGSAYPSGGAYEPAPKVEEPQTVEVIRGTEKKIEGVQ